MMSSFFIARELVQARVVKIRDNIDSNQYWPDGTTIYLSVFVALLLRPQIVDDDRDVALIPIPKELPSTTH